MLLAFLNFALNQVISVFDCFIWHYLSIFPTRVTLPHLPHSRVECECKAWPLHKVNMSPAEHHAGDQVKGGMSRIYIRV